MNDLKESFVKDRSKLVDRTGKTKAARSITSLLKERKSSREKIKIVLERKILPDLRRDGGNLEMINFKNGILYLKITGLCRRCPLSKIILLDFVETQLMLYLSEVREIVFTR